MNSQKSIIWFFIVEKLEKAGENLVESVENPHEGVKKNFGNQE